MIRRVTGRTAFNCLGRYPATVAQPVEEVVIFNARYGENHGHRPRPVKKNNQKLIVRPQTEEVKEEVKEEVRKERGRTIFYFTHFGKPQYAFGI